ncbi:MAG: hypothetical protein CVU96_00540 [Firmicutes bacterium HGW-Firmicutes-20]|jgi:hypothetical protein|nr:MAG: hypothetical protein CVU96_00540 [Firmicutes bacterium HGW-Firmicutes-20]PKM86411.1 MAG: hypothetical protein CVU85_08020 [Firmicutes bacterium HGW-Firmicutes-10]
MKKFIAKIVNKTNVIAVILSLLIFMSFIIFILPQEAAKSEAFGLTENIDTSFVYTADDLYRIADSYGEEGRAFYIRQRFTFDLIWPIAYTQFLLIASAYFYKKTKLLKASYLLYVSLVAAGFDYLENIMASIVLYRFPQTTPILADISGIMTLMKWSTLSLSFLILIFFMIVGTFTQLKQRFTQ